MKDLIERQAAIDAINTWDKFGVDERCRIVRWHEGLEPYVHLRDVLTAIVNLPAAQPERKTGKWIPQDNNKTNGMASTLVYYYPKCSVCGHCDNYTNYCPNCGADMRERREG